MQFRKLSPLIFLIVTLLSGCSVFEKIQGTTKVSPILMINNQFNPSIEWSIPIGNGTKYFYSLLHPAYANGIGYAADREGIVKAINIYNGKEIWTANLAEKSNWFFKVPALLSGGLTVYNNHVYVGTEKAYVYALNVSNGSIEWQTRVAGEVLARPVVNDNAGIILVNTSNGQLQALDKNSGKIKWTTNLGISTLSLRGTSAPATIYDIAIVGDNNGLISAVLLQKGYIIWRQCISNIIGPTEIDRLRDIHATPIIIDKVIYTLPYNGNLTAIDLYSGQIIWQCELGSVNDFIIHNNRIYISDKNNRILAISTDSGTILWAKGDLLNHLVTAPVLYKDNLVIGDSKGYIYWLNPQNGCFIAKQKINNSGFLSNPIIADNKILIQARDGTLYAITC